MKAILFPGQGSQMIGMGKDLFEKYPSMVNQVDNILGYSIEEFCLKDPERKLNLTQYTQPALYVVNCLTYLDQYEGQAFTVDFLAGHSLGEYSALFAAGAFDFVTGLKIVKLRGELMGSMGDGAMAAVIGMSYEELFQALQDSQVEDVDIANHNSQTQIVISGTREGIKSADEILRDRSGVRVAYLRVSAAFHSRFMQPITETFEDYLSQVNFFNPNKTVISNVTAQPFPQNSEEIKKLLVAQLTSPVKWHDTIRYLLENRVDEFEESGPGKVLTKILGQIRRNTGSETKSESLSPESSKEKTAIFNTMRKNILEIIVELSESDVTPEKQLKELGANSVDRADILMQTLEDLNVKLPLVEFGRAKNIAELTDIIYHKATT